MLVKNKLHGRREICFKDHAFLNGEKVVTEIATFPGGFSFHLRVNLIDSKFTGVLAFLPILIISSAK